MPSTSITTKLMFLQKGNTANYILNIDITFFHSDYKDAALMDFMTKFSKKWKMKLKVTVQTSMYSFLKRMMINRIKTSDMDSSWELILETLPPWTVNVL